MLQLVTIDVTGNVPDGLGALPYQAHPRIGERIEIQDEEGMAAIFEVVAVVHSTLGGASDLYVRRVGPSADAMKSLCGR